MVYIYILKLENGKYYVGKTTNPSFRIETHFKSNGSAWTSKYNPISIEAIFPDCDDYDEDKYTKKYMAKYGIENVRGGSYVQIKLSEFHTEALKMEIWGANDRCTQCGRSGHFVKDCYAKTDISGNAINKAKKIKLTTQHLHQNAKRQFNKIDFNYRLWAYRYWASMRI